MGDAGQSDQQRPSGSVRREINLPRFHDQHINARMKEQGIGRSEAVRQFVNESLGRHGKLARLEIRQRAAAIKLHCQECRLHPSHAARHLQEIELFTDEIVRLAADAM